MNLLVKINIGNSDISCVRCVFMVSCVIIEYTAKTFYKTKHSSWLQGSVGTYFILFEETWLSITNETFEC